MDVVLVYKIIIISNHLSNFPKETQHEQLNDFCIEFFDSSFVVLRDALP